MMNDRQDWLEQRRKGIGGSDASVICGLNPYKSLYELYLDKKGLLPEKEDSEAMRQGRDLEPYVVSRFEEATGKKCRRENKILQNKENPFMLANVDRLIIGEDAGLECKTTSIMNLKRFKNGEFPSEYYVQCVHYMAVTGRKKWYLAVLILNQGLHIFEINRDEAEIKALIEAEREFWEDNILKDIEPSPDGSDRCGEAIKNMFPTAEEGASVPLFGFENTLKEIVDLGEEIKAKEKELEQLKQLIQKELGAAENGIVDGFKVKWSNCSRSNFDAKSFAKDNSDIDLSDYYKQINYRKFEVKEL